MAYVPGMPSTGIPKDVRQKAEEKYKKEQEERKKSSGGGSSSPTPYTPPSNNHNNSNSGGGGGMPSDVQEQQNSSSKKTLPANLAVGAFLMQKGVDSRNPTSLKTAYSSVKVQQKLLQQTQQQTRISVSS